MIARLTMTDSEARAAYKFIKDNLKTHAKFACYGAGDIKESYNGTGSDSTPSVIRRILTRYTRFAKEAVAEHDLTWWLVEEGVISKTREEFLASNKRLKDNMRKCAKLRYHWSNPYRWWCHAKGWIAERACNKYGWESWVA